MNERTRGPVSEGSKAQRLKGAKKTPSSLCPFEPFLTPPCPHLPCGMECSDASQSPLWFRKRQLALPHSRQLTARLRSVPSSRPRGTRGCGSGTSSFPAPFGHPGDAHGAAGREVDHVFPSRDRAFADAEVQHRALPDVQRLVEAGDVAHTPTDAVRHEPDALRRGLNTVRRD